MLILLPPSEGKTPPVPGTAVDLDALAFPSLAPARRKVRDALVETSGRDDALTLLKVSTGLAPEVARNLALVGADAAPAAQVYTGVLYAAADLAGAAAGAPGTPARDRLPSVLTISALWGAVTPLDVIPAYRLSMSVDLPGIGPLGAFWRELLDDVLAPRAAGDVVVDCRSSSYVSAWRPGPGADWVMVKVLRELDGKRSVVSHNAKHTRGVLTGHLLRRAGEPPHTRHELLDAARELVGSELREATLHEAARGAHTLELVV